MFRHTVRTAASAGLFLLLGVACKDAPSEPIAPETPSAEASVSVTPPDPPKVPEATPVVFGRKLREGEKFGFERRMSHTVVTTESVGDQPGKETREVIETSISGTGQALKLDERGNDIEVEYTVASLKRRRNDEAEWSLPAGTKVNVVRGTPDRPGSLHVGGRAASPVETEALSPFIALTVKEIRDNEIYGSTTPRRVGDKWEPNWDLLIADIANAGLVVSAKDLTGSVELVAVRPSPMGELREVRTAVTTSKVGLTQTPPGVEIGASSIRQSGTSQILPDGYRRESSLELVSELELFITKPGEKKRKIVRRDDTTLVFNETPL